jgi:hypothetical protein
MNSFKATAHRAGVLYFLFMIVAITQEFFLPTFMVAGDAAATARNITAAEPMYRIGVVIGLVSLVMFIFLVALLYKLLKEVDRTQARLMVLLVVVGVAISLANEIPQFAPLVLLSSADYLSAFSKPQLNALSLAFLSLHSSGSAVVMAFWGLWLFPFGILVFKSRFFPRILGILLVIAGCGYVTSSATSMVLPEYSQVVFRALMPLFFGEVPIIFWLLIKGAKVPQPQARSSDAN